MPVSWHGLTTTNMCVSHLVTSSSLRPHGLQPTRLLCPWGFSRQEYWSGLPFPFPGDLPDPGIEPPSPALQADSLPSELQGGWEKTRGGFPTGFSTDVKSTWNWGEQSQQRWSNARGVDRHRYSLSWAPLTLAQIFAGQALAEPLSMGTTKPVCNTGVFLAELFGSFHTITENAAIAKFDL